MQGSLTGDVLKTQFVGAADGRYQGPIARVEFDEDWLVINTDDHEGKAILNIEALPYLLQALERVREALRTPVTIDG
jgi:hypothetical protein